MLKSKSTYYRHFVFSGILLVLVLSVRGQNLNLLTPYLNEKNQKEIDKASEEIKKAGDLVQEANQYYNEALALQSNYELDEQTLQKKLKSAESKAVNTQLKADKIYQATNKKIIEICKKAIEEKGAMNPNASTYIENAKQMVSQADEKRKSSNDVNNVYEKATLLNDASGLESAAIESYISALTVGNNDELPEELAVEDQSIENQIQTEILISLKDTTESSSSPSSQNLSVNQGLIDKYNSYVNDPTMPEPLVVSRSGVTGNAPDNLDGLAEYYLKYKNGEAFNYEPPVAQSGDTSGYGPLAASTDTASTGYSGDEYSKEVSVVSEPSAINDQTAGYTPEPQSKEAAKEKPLKEERTTNPDEIIRTRQLRSELNISEGQEDQVRFVVQLAASRIPLTRSQLWAIYPGNLTIEVIRDLNWYRYQITGFRIFSEANRVAIESGVKEAYVIAYFNKKEINLVKARELTRRFEEDFVKNPSKSVAFQPDYYIQVHASKFALSDVELQSICNEPGTCRVIIEGGWFKYQYYGGLKYNEALNFSKSLSGKSFVVAYRGGTRINLYKAVKNEK